MIDALVVTGAYLNQHAAEKRSADAALEKLNARFFDTFEEIIRSENRHNGWFTEKNVRKALGAIADSLTRNSIITWMDRYPKLPVKNESDRKRVGVVMAGNIPLVGFHDMLSVIMSGNYFKGKPSSKDDRLLKIVADVICHIEPDFSDRIEFTESYLKEIEAIIATGSNNTSRYFEYYFRDIPHIIRKNRNGVAILSGSETKEELTELGKDIFSYFGLGCRNVTKIYIPENYKLEVLLEALESFYELRNHHKYMNNLEYNRSIYLMNSIPFLDNGVLLIREEQQISSPVGVVYYEKYLHLDILIKKLEAQKGQLQCIVSTIGGIAESIKPGTSQTPALWDYADGIDTMEFLINLKK
jgi:hypothetical protein